MSTASQNLHVRRKASAKPACWKTHAIACMRLFVHAHLRAFYRLAPSASRSIRVHPIRRFRSLIVPRAAAADNSRSLSPSAAARLQHREGEGKHETPPCTRSPPHIHSSTITPSSPLRRKCFSIIRALIGRLQTRDLLASKPPVDAGVRGGGGEGKGGRKGRDDERNE